MRRGSSARRPPGARSRRTATAGSARRRWGPWGRALLRHPARRRALSVRSAGGAVADCREREPGSGLTDTAGEPGTGSPARKVIGGWGQVRWLRGPRGSGRTKQPRAEQVDLGAPGPLPLEPLPPIDLARGLPVALTERESSLNRRPIGPSCPCEPREVVTTARLRLIQPDWQSLPPPAGAASRGSRRRGQPRWQGQGPRHGTG